jgi:DNA-binding PadR family transcriptional regulator
MTVATELTPNELCLLALLVERPAHGWGLAGTLSRNGEIGQIWSVARPLVYTALRRLEADGYIETAGIERGNRGPHRVVYRPTKIGAKTAREWLLEPVEHVRDIRSLFLLKVVLAQRVGLDAEPLLVAQRALVVPLVGFLESRLDDVDPAREPAEATVLLFRVETAKTTVRLIDHVLDQVKAAKRRATRPASRRRPA